MCQKYKTLHFKPNTLHNMHEIMLISQIPAQQVFINVSNIFYYYSSTVPSKHQYSNVKFYHKQVQYSSYASSDLVAQLVATNSV